MKVLFIGGTGIISSAVSRLAVKRGIELYHLNRGKSHRKIEGVISIVGNIRNVEQTKELLKDDHFDVVVNWISFVPEHILADIEIFSDITDQYIFISSASAYEKPISKLPITEKTPLINPFWQYSRDKAACEKILMEAQKNTKFPGYHCSSISYLRQYINPNRLGLYNFGQDVKRKESNHSRGWNFALGFNA